MPRLTTPDREMFVLVTSGSKLEVNNSGSHPAAALHLHLDLHSVILQMILRRVTQYVNRWRNNKQSTSRLSVLSVCFQDKTCF